MKAPIVRQISWPAAIPQFAFLGRAILAGFYVVDNSNGALFGVLAYLMFSFGSKMIIARDHQVGMTLIRNQQYEAAIQAFERSYRFFAEYRWIDRFRSVVLMSASATSYREMALCNIAFSYSQLGKGGKAEEFYRKALEAFPESGLAASAVRLIESSKNT